MNIENMEGWKDFSPNKQTALVRLQKEVRKKSILIGVYYAILFLVTVLLINFVNVQFLKNNLVFGWLAGFTNGCFIGKMFVNDMRDLHDMIRSEVSSILND